MHIVLAGERKREIERSAGLGTESEIWIADEFGNSWGVLPSLHE